MDIRHLRYFIAISEEPSLSAAAQRLGVAQPSLSQHVINLEAELGVALLRRSPRGILLTENGERLVRHARQICRAVDDCLAEMKEAGGTPAGTVAFGLPPSISMVLSVPLVETARIELPQVRLRATEAMSGTIRGWLADQSVDIGFLYDLDPRDRFDAVHLLDETLCFFAPPDDWPLPTPPGEPVQLGALAGRDLILPSQGHGLRRMLARAAKAAGVTLDVVIELDAMTQIKDLVARGSGYTILSPAAAHDFVARGELLKAPLTGPGTTRPVYLVTNPERPMTNACRAVERTTRAVAVDLVRRGIWEGRLAPGLGDGTAPSVGSAAPPAW